MSTLSPKLIKKINCYVNQQFNLNNKSSEDVKEIKEEIKAHMLLEIEELISNGKTEGEALALTKKSLGDNTEFTAWIPSNNSHIYAPILLILSYVLYIPWGIYQIVLYLFNTQISINNSLTKNLDLLTNVSSWLSKTFLIATILFLIWTAINLFLKILTTKFNLLNLFIASISLLQCYLIFNKGVAYKSTYGSLNLLSLLPLIYLFLFFISYSKKIYGLKKEITLSSLLSTSYILFIIYTFLEIVIRLGWSHIFTISIPTLRILSCYTSIIFIISTSLFLTWTLVSFIFKSIPLKYKLLNLLVLIILALLCYITIKTSTYSILPLKIYNINSIIVGGSLILFFLLYSKKINILNII